ncbi:male sterility protein [Sarocladium implicatum]|nr:male sterility protein [Sarocladium implicatum]
MGGSVRPNYFTCTLGEAQHWKSKHTDTKAFSDVINLIDTQAEDCPDLPAIGFSVVEEVADPPQARPLLTFRELFAQSKLAADALTATLIESERTSGVGLLCTSSLDFVLTWLGLTRLGLSVLLLAPQLEPIAIKHLCESAKVATVFTDQRQESRLQPVAQSVKVARIPSYRHNQANGHTPPDENPGQGLQIPDVPSIAIWFHSSGTSSGLPKLIPQTHKGLVAVLPSFTEHDQPATFSTTPLYHGGLVDALRAWSSGAMAWFFPEGQAPITAANVVRAVTDARATGVSHVGYFSTVPYILQMLADDETGLQILRSMRLVGVGGAALPEATGNKLVEAGVPLLSRMGSAECGFLMSSHRDYATDLDWQYLRPVVDDSLIAFELQPDGLAELVVKPGWPNRGKVNREEGSFATSDLFESHPSREGLWRYHSRADAQITLSNGKKFDPSPMEDSIMASSGHLLRDVLVFGDGRDYPGVLLIPKTSDNNEALIGTVWTAIETLNRDTQSHARISRPMVIVSQAGGLDGLEKSSKGTILRRRANERFVHEIEGAYSGSREEHRLPESASLAQLKTAITDCFHQVLNWQVRPDEDLYRQGVDSIVCIQIRARIQASCIPPNGPQLPLNILYDKGTVISLVHSLWRLRQELNGEKVSQDHQDSQESNFQTMRDLAERYRAMTKPFILRDAADDHHVVLTGSTGFLGSHILHNLLMDAQVRTVYCLIRAQTPEEAELRLQSTQETRCMSGYLDDRVVCVPCNLVEENLGLTPELQDVMAQGATLIIHSAWAVNFSLNLWSFEDQIQGAVNLTNFAARSGARMVFISSTAAVSESISAVIAERISHEPRDSSPLGYSQSKWVAEQACDAGARGLTGSLSSPKRPPVVIIRVGQLCGDEKGRWSASEAYPLMLSTARLLGCLPDIEGETINWMPVHLAAQAVVEIAFNETVDSLTGEAPVFHVNNNHRTPTWEQMLHWLKEDHNDRIDTPSFEVLPASQWVSTLEKEALRGGRQHPAYALLGLWKNAFESREDTRYRSSGTPKRFDTGRSMQVSGVMRTLQPLDQRQLVDMWRWVNQTIV